MREITEAQRSAIRHVREQAVAVQTAAHERCRQSLSRALHAESGILEQLLTQVRVCAPITLNFHPDRLLPAGYTVVQGLLRDGVYRSQFVTGVSNGSRTAYAGGERDRWERQLFGGAYHAGLTTPGDRPAYGALNLMKHADGGSPRFGSCYLRLHPHVVARSTFTYGDSHLGPTCVGTIDAFEPLLAALLAEVEQTGTALGLPGQTVASCAAWMLALGSQSTDGETGIRGRALDDYIEAQIHGALRLTEDVEAIVADPSYRHTVIGEQLAALCVTYGCRLDWHPGFRLAADDVPDDFRGPVMPSFARWIAREYGDGTGLLDAATIGRAAADQAAGQVRWRKWGTAEETSQLIKQLWHVIVQFG